MRIVIVGAGTVGTQLAKQLIQEKHDVSLIEADGERARHTANRMDCLVIQGEGNSIRTLEEAGIAKADALVCVTGSDEMNMITCGLAESRYPGMLKIARVRNDEYAGLNQPGAKRSGAAEPGGGRLLGIDHFIHPDVEASLWVLNAIEHQAMGNIISFHDTAWELGTIDVAGGALEGLSLMSYRTVFPAESLVTLVERKSGDDWESILPTGSTVLLRGDRVSILAQEADMNRIFLLAGQAEKPLRKIGIAGGSRVGTLIAEGLLAREGKRRGTVFSALRKFIARQNRRVVIIEEDYHVCRELADRFPELLVLNEDITDENFIAEEQLGDLDLIVTATARQDLNIITAAYLKSRGVLRAIALVTSPGYAAIARQLGIDVVIPMKSVIVDTILARLMGGGIRGLHRLGEGQIGILEFETGPGAPAGGKALKDCRFPEGTLVMLVQRGDRSFIPKGDDVFSPGDRVILITKNGNEAEMSRFFGAGGGEA
ncbi:MAG: NAD-binding protein [Spirochaetaceae bacterium]|jgi:trk system potassium uptake protein TrkA|nr:NAD-binding protein [Spirochaetaceae bacterium]